MTRNLKFEIRNSKLETGDLIKHLLWTTDFSEAAEAAWAWAVMLSGAFGARLTLLHVVTDWTCPYREGSLKGADPDDINRMVLALQNQHTGWANKRLEEKVRQLREGDRKASVEAAVVLGTPHLKILEYAEEAKVDLIVMGTRGAESWEQKLLGSTTARVVQGALVPVLAVRGQLETQVQRILVPTDFSRATFPALDYALELAATFGARVHLLHVVESSEQLAESEVMQRLITLSYEELTRWAWERSGGDQMIEAHVIRRQSAVRGISEFVGEHQIDLIVMPSHGRTGLVRFLWGSVTEQVVRETPCPVIAARTTSFRQALSPRLGELRLLRHVPIGTSI